VSLAQPGAPVEDDVFPRQILEACRDIVIVTDRESRIVWGNRAFLQARRKTLEEVRGQLALPRSPNGSRHYLDDDARVFATGQAVEIPEEPVILADGRAHWLHVIKTPLFDASGKSTMLVMIARDVTETRATSLALDRINQCLIEFGPDSVANISRLTALCGELLGADTAVYNRLEKGVLSAVGQWNVPADFNPVNSAQGTLCGEALAHGGDGLVLLSGLSGGLIAGTSPQTDAGPRTFAGMAVKKGGDTAGILCIMFRGEVVADSISPKIMGIIASAIGLEEERLRRAKATERLAEELRQAQKMQAVGRLAAGIAHDFNNALTVIKGYAEMIRAAGAGGGSSADAVEILESVERAEALTRQLLAFGRRQRLVPRVIDMNETVRSTARLLARLLRENVRVSLELPPSPMPVHADPGQMEQVLMNLALNAGDAMPAGGMLTLRVREALEGEIPPDEQGHATGGPYVVVCVADTGGGINPEIRPHLFEPFFTTKENGKGAGLGLATVYGIVTQSGGRISCESGPGPGTEFRVWLPLSSAEIAAIPEPGTLADLRGSGALLLVEDDRSIRDMLTRALRGAGYEVSAAADAEEALTLAGRPDARVDVLVTDVMMPGLGGRQLALRLEKERPSLKIVYMSGYTDDAAFRSALRPGTAFLQKPFKPSELCRLLKDLTA
jgi:PAS domain S-box-containing protein